MIFSCSFQMSMSIFQKQDVKIHDSNKVNRAPFFKEKERTRLPVKSSTIPYSIFTPSEKRLNPYTINLQYNNVKK